jgi:hypothetical protein
MTVTRSLQPQSFALFTFALQEAAAYAAEAAEVARSGSAAASSSSRQDASISCARVSLSSGLQTAMHFWRRAKASKELVVPLLFSAYEALPLAALPPPTSCARAMWNYPQEARATTHGLSHAQAPAAGEGISCSLPSPGTKHLQITYAMSNSIYAMSNSSIPRPSLCFYTMNTSPNNSD